MLHTRRFRDFRPLIACGVLAVLGCGEGTGQSALDPAGPAAEAIAWLWWIMCVAFTAVFVLVLVLLALALRRRPNRGGLEATINPPLGSNGFVVGGGIVLPVVTLVPLLLISLDSTRYLRVPQDAFTIKVVGHMWWWEITYPEHGIVTANEIYVPAGQPIRLELESADVVHSFWVPSLNGKRDLIPGLTNEFWLHADEPGVYRGQCGEYCGTQHANMILHVIALPPEEFQDWVDDRRAAVGNVAGADHGRGPQIFRARGCSVCHTIRGTGATGRAGPDLTHIGSRRMIAGMLPNTRGNMAGWIGDPQAIKPGMRMPRTYLPAVELLEVTDYLRSLK
jgi:cytochrome c oxidase subunit II